MRPQSQVIASKNYKPGEIIYSEKPFVKVVDHRLWDKVCAGCLKSKDPLRKCTGCGIMKYCGKECQRKAWPDHKVECPYLPNYKDFKQQNLVHMIGNIILKLKGKDWKTFTARILNVEINFDELVSDPGNTRGSYQILESQGIEEPLKLYIGEENMPDQVILKKLIGKITVNRFCFEVEKSMVEDKVGWALFLGASKMDHSCVSNATWDVTASSIAVRAIKPIKKFEQVTIHYCSVLDENDPLVFNNLQKSWNKCYCSDCSQPYGTSDLTKVLDFRKASGVIRTSKYTLLLISLLRKLNFPVGDVVGDGRLERILSAQKDVLGRTNRLRLQMLAALHFRSGPADVRRRGLRELERAVKQVWGEYYPELNRIYRKLAFFNMEAGNPEEARNYTQKMLQLDEIFQGKPFDGSNEAIEREMINILEENHIHEFFRDREMFGRLFKMTNCLFNT